MVKTYFLDATGRYLPLEIPAAFIQGKEALIGFGEGKFRIETVPVMPPKTNSYIQKSVLRIKDKHIIGTEKTTLSGYYKIDFFNELETNSSDTELKDYYTQKLRKGSNKFLTESFEEMNKYTYDEDFRIKYQFNIKDYAKQLGDEIYVNLNLKREASDFRTETERENEIEVTYKSYYSFENTMDIPKNYSLEYMPENYELNNAYGGL
jgi:hypothetical protein